MNPETLTEHEYRYGFESNCTCGNPVILTWDDWVKHISPLFRELE